MLWLWSPRIILIPTGIREVSVGPAGKRALIACYHAGSCVFLLTSATEKHRVKIRQLWETTKCSSIRDTVTDISSWFNGTQCSVYNERFLDYKAETAPLVKFISVKNRKRLRNLITLVYFKTSVEPCDSFKQNNMPVLFDFFFKQVNSCS